MFSKLSRISQLANQPEGSRYPYVTTTRVDERATTMLTVQFSELEFVSLEIPQEVEARGMPYVGSWAKEQLEKMVGYLTPGELRGFQLALRSG